MAVSGKCPGGGGRRSLPDGQAIGIVEVKRSGGIAFYRKPFALFINLLYRFRKIFRCWDGNVYIHQINALLKMEEIARSFKHEQ